LLRFRRKRFIREDGTMVIESQPITDIKYLMGSFAELVRQGKLDEWA